MVNQNSDLEKFITMVPNWKEEFQNADTQTKKMLLSALIDQIEVKTMISTSNLGYDWRTLYYLKVLVYLPLRVYPVQGKGHDGQGIGIDCIFRPGGIDFRGYYVLDIIPVTDIVITGRGI